MNKYIIVLLVNISIVNSQETNNRITFTIENDKFALLDQYYTNGLFFSYSYGLKNNFLFFKKENAKLQLEFALLQETYTPSNLRSNNVLDFDRPYAGWLGFLTQVYSIKDRRSFSVGGEIGITGKGSRSGDLQTWWHNLLRIEIPTWEEEIGGKFLVNLNAKYIYNLLTSTNAALDYNIETSIGLKDINLSTGLDIVLGKVNNFNNASRIGVASTNQEKEFYGIIGFNYKRVIHNTTIQGDLNFDDRLFTTEITENIASAKTGLYYKSRNSLISLEYHFLTKETPTSNGHIYGGLTYGYHF